MYAPQRDAGDVRSDAAIPRKRTHTRARTHTYTNAHTHTHTHMRVRSQRGAGEVRGDATVPQGAGAREAGLRHHPGVPHSLSPARALALSFFVPALLYLSGAHAPSLLSISSLSPSQCPTSSLRLFCFSPSRASLSCTLHLPRSLPPALSLPPLILSRSNFLPTHSVSFPFSSPSLPPSFHRPPSTLVAILPPPDPRPSSSLITAIILQSPTSLGDSVL
jgi:hypothetical protein